MKLRPFHLAMPVRDLALARQFYGETLGLTEGRSASHWVDFDFFGHQLVFHQVPVGAPPLHHNSVDGDSVPVPHFGIVLTWEDWEILSKKLKATGISFVIEPHIRFTGLPGEQATLFFIDPNGLALEFKAFKADSQLFLNS